MDCKVDQDCRPWFQSRGIFQVALHRIGGLENA